MRVACEARACRCLCREHGPGRGARAPGRSGPSSCGLCRGPVPAEGPVWDAMPRLVLTVASRRRGPPLLASSCSSSSPAPRRLLRFARARSLLPPSAPSPAPCHPPPPPPHPCRPFSGPRARAAVTRVHACACRGKHASSPAERPPDFLGVASASDRKRRARRVRRTRW